MMMLGEDFFPYLYQKNIVSYIRIPVKQYKNKVQSRIVGGVWWRGYFC